MNSTPVRLRSQRTTSDGGTLTETETWVGGYGELRQKQASLGKSAKSTVLVPEQAGTARLTVVRETDLPRDPEAPAEETNEILEVIWQELRLPVESHPAFSDLSADEIRSARAAAESEDTEAPTAELAAKLFDLLVRGTTEYVIGVPVVRRTRERRQGNEGGGQAWYREEPPVAVAGDWEWLKTADERRREGGAFSLVEEWTGATEWDETLYPPAPD